MTPCHVYVWIHAFTNICIYAGCYIFWKNRCPPACHVLGPPAESLGMDAKIPRLGTTFVGILSSIAFDVEISIVW